MTPDNNESSFAALIRERRTIHQFKPGQVPAPELLENAISDAIWAPNHHLTQPWQFKIIGAETADRICRLNSELVKDAKGERMAQVKLKRWREIPGWLLMSYRLDDDELRRKEDYAACCCVAQNLALLLWEQGVGLKWTTGAVTRDAGFFPIVGLDPNREGVVGLFWYGFPLDIPAGNRRSSDEFLSYLP